MTMTATPKADVGPVVLPSFGKRVAVATASPRSRNARYRLVADERRLHGSR
ncbi:MAG: hypothetical protein ACI89X_004698 [Planctomycetota bacterium]|jgi:hypothetical protein